MTAIGRHGAVPVAPHHRRGLVLMLISVVCFTMNVLLVRALGEMHAANIWLVSCARFIVGIGLILTLFRAHFEPAHLWHSRKLVERGLVGGIGVYLTYLTVVKIGAGRATFIGNTYMIWGPVLAIWMLQERLRPALVTGGLVTLAGLALITNVFSVAHHPGVYDLAAIVGAWFSAYVVVTIRQLHATEHTSTIFGAQCVYGLALCSVPAAITYQPLGFSAWMVMLLASFAAGGGQLAMTRAFRELPVAEGSMVQMLVPIGVSLGGFAFFGEGFSVRELAGAALILVGTGFASVPR